ncbi:MAG: hypothetical protein NXI30_16015 [bacterium]|nr:hypothetical protein [bacterium]
MQDFASCIRGWRRTAVSSCVLGLLVAVPGDVAALDFALADRVYLEDFDAETGYPTVPDIDLLGLGGQIGQDVLTDGTTGAGAPELIGGVARGLVTLDFPLPFPISEVTVVDATNWGLGDIGMRGRFAGTQMVGDGSGFASMRSTHVDGADVYRVTMTVLMVRSGATESASLRLELFELFGPTTASTLDLTPAEANALLGGAIFDLDLFLDRAAQLATGSISIQGFSEEEVSLSIAAADGVAPTEFLHGGGFATISATSFQIDEEIVEYYDAVAAPTPVPSLGWRGAWLVCLLALLMGVVSLRPEGAASSPVGPKRNGAG